MEHGRTPNCEGCNAPKTSRDKRNYKPHKPECQERVKLLKNNKIKEPEPPKHKTGKVTTERLQEHNNKNQEDRHKISLLKDRPLLICQKCDALAPTNMVMAFQMENCPEGDQDMNITTR